MEEAVEDPDEVREGQRGQDPPLPVGVDPLGADRARQPRQMLRRWLLQTTHLCIYSRE